MTEDLRAMLREAQIACTALLQESLPGIGGTDWWRRTVKWRLSVPQERALDERGITELSGLDLAALLRVLEKNWYELSTHLRLPREGRALINEVRNIRNRFAHESLAGTPAHDLYRDADTLCRFLALVRAGSGAIATAERLRDRLLQGMADGAGRAHYTSAAGQPVADDEPLLAEIDDESPADRPAGPPAGVPVASLQPGPGLQAVASVLSDATFVGIDFGTSTTAVSMARLDPEARSLIAEPVSIRQVSASGAATEFHLVPSCIAHHEGKVLIGIGAAQLRGELTEGKNLWTSFKMRLGIDLGPQYPYTELPSGAGPTSIERPQDAARHFLAFIREQVEEFVQQNNLPPRVYYSVSVPAGFEANQRQDLVNALAEAGIDVDEQSLIDEPNAAFLSYLTEMQYGVGSAAFMARLTESPKKILVFDFGAGTCDISILEISLADGRLSSTNLSVSRFMALGGDDIDRAIARQVLLPQLCGSRSPSDCFTVNELETTVLPRLKAEAEQLKIACSKAARNLGLRGLTALRQAAAAGLTGRAIPAFTLRGERWELAEPEMSLAQFAGVMEAFLTAQDPEKSAGPDSPPSVLGPIENALKKAGLGKADLHMVLFIGGSAENPLVTQCIEDYFGRFVDCVHPRDLRSHVSQGAAVNSLFVHGLGWDLIQPITSEPVFVITRDGNLEQVVAAGTPVPSAESAVTVLRVREDGQKKVELPFCVGTAEKVLAVISLDPPLPSGHFMAGDEIRVSCSLTREKLLKASIRAGGRALTARIMNPLANAELTPRDRKFMEARQALNESILKGGGRPTVVALLNYAWAAGRAKRWREAAEIFEAVERLDSARDFATNIAYNYAMARDTSRSDAWSEKAHQRKPDSVTAYNLALVRDRAGDKKGYEELMQQSLVLDGDETATLCAYGAYLHEGGNPRGIEMLERASDLLGSQLRAGTLDDGDVWRLRRCAKTLGLSSLLEDLKAYERKIGAKEYLFDESLLAAGGEISALPKGD
jgi:molecular chaperone DnaK (HSP70)